MIRSVFFKVSSKKGVVIKREDIYKPFLLQCIPHTSTTFQHNLHHYWGIYRVRAQVFLSPHCRIHLPVRTLCDNCKKFKENEEIVNLLSSWIVSSTARTKSSLIKDGRPVCCSSSTETGPWLNFLTHLLIIPSLMASSPYTSQSSRWMSAGLIFLALKKRITYHISVGRVLNHFKNFNWSQLTTHTHGLKLWNLHAQLAWGMKKKTRMCKITIPAMQWL